MIDKFIMFGAPQIEQAEIDEIISAMKSGWIGTGPRVAGFESEFAVYKSVTRNRVAAVNSCTAALHVSMIAAGLKGGDEVITTPLTFCATVNSIIHAGATPVLADIHPDTMNINPAEIEKMITPRTRAIVPVHYAGRSCDMDSIKQLAEKHSLKVIEDCAHAIETEYKGQKAGTIGDYGCFSFYVTKNVMTGEGGMVIAKKEKDIERIKILALHGMSKDAWDRFSDNGFKHYQVVECGFKYNMMDIQAAMGIHQLRRVEANWKRREEIWNRFQEAFEGLPLTRPMEPEPDTRHALHLYTILIDEKTAGFTRDSFLDAMHRKKIGTSVHYLSIPEHPFYRENYGFDPAHFPVARKTGRETASLPLSAKLTDNEVDYIIESVRGIFSGKK